MKFNGQTGLSLFHVSGVAKVIEEMGALVHYLPPYSPDYYPIEILFSNVKLSLKALELEMNG